MSSIGLPTMHYDADKLVLLTAYIDLRSTKLCLRRTGNTLPSLDALGRIRGHVQGPRELEEVVKLYSPVRLPVEVKTFQLED